MEIIFDDNGLHVALAPFTLTKPVADIRFGIKTISETWIELLSAHFKIDLIAYNTETYLYSKYPKGSNQNALTLAGNVKPTTSLINHVVKLEQNSSLYINNKWIATKGEKNQEIRITSEEEILSIEKPWHIFQRNSAAIQLDFTHLKKTNRISQPLSDTNRIIGDNIFIEEGATVEHAILNSSTGPIFIGKDAEIMEGAIIRGPFALNEHGVVKMGAKIYGATTIGPHCKVGGELSNCIFQAYSNKGHDGFLGNSVVGEWCNFGADTNSSNLKNNYSNVKVYNYQTEQIEASDIMFCGVLMGDHSKTGINTMLNTATVVGVSANIFGGGFPKKYIPSFTWGGIEKTDRFILEKAFEVAENMMKRRNISLSSGDRVILTHLYKELA